MGVGLFKTSGSPPRTEFEVVLKMLNFSMSPDDSDQVSQMSLVNKFFLKEYFLSADYDLDSNGYLGLGELFLLNAIECLNVAIFPKLYLSGCRKVDQEKTS